MEYITLEYSAFTCSPLQSSILRKMPTESMFNSVHNYKVTVYTADDKAQKNSVLILR
jgi:hypothetical protein